MEDIKIVKRCNKIIENESKEQKSGFVSMFLGTLGVKLLGNLMSDKGMKAVR